MARLTATGVGGKSEEEGAATACAEDTDMADIAATASHDEAGRGGPEDAAPAAMGTVALGSMEVDGEQLQGQGSIAGVRRAVVDQSAAGHGALSPLSSGLAGGEAGGAPAATPPHGSGSGSRSGQAATTDALRPQVG